MTGNELIALIQEFQEIAGGDIDIEVDTDSVDANPILRFEWHQTMTHKEVLRSEWKDSYQELSRMQKDRDVFARHGAEYPKQAEFDKLVLACKVVEAQLLLMSDSGEKDCYPIKSIEQILENWENKNENHQ
jgi:hypothetical protein